MCVRQWLISDFPLSLAVFLVGSRNYLQLQHFTHFMITAEAFDPATNRESIAGPKRVGRFQLFGDALTKFYEMCVNTVSEADDLPKTEVQVSIDYVCVCVRLFTTFGIRVDVCFQSRETTTRKLRRRRSKSFSVRSFSSDWQFRAQLNSIIYENKDLFFHLFHPQQPPRVMFRFSPFPPPRAKTSQCKNTSPSATLSLLFCFVIVCVTLERYFVFLSPHFDTGISSLRLWKFNLQIVCAREHRNGCGRLRMNFQLVSLISPRTEKKYIYKWKKEVEKLFSFSIRTFPIDVIAWVCEGESLRHPKHRRDDMNPW